MPRAAKSGNIDSPKESVSFRADPSLVQLLTEEAKKHRYKSPGRYARHLVQQALAGSELAEIRSEIDKLHGAIQEIHECIATLALAVLVKLGNEDPQKAEQWVREHMLR